MNLPHGIKITFMSMRVTTLVKNYDDDTNLHVWGKKKEHYQY